jgi:long-chain acyl-CoA synthetase
MARPDRRRILRRHRGQRHDVHQRGRLAATPGVGGPTGPGYSPYWSALGDIGYVDEDGYIYLTDRKAFTVISGGVNIYPAEIEACLIMHPSVTDIAVFGLPDPEMGEYVHAVVQPADGVEGSPELAEELLRYARDQLARYKVPRVVDFRAELPRLPTGKLYKQGLRDEYRKAMA